MKTIRQIRSLQWLSSGVGPIGLLLVGLGFSLTLPHFGTLGNATNILQQFGPLALLALGQMFVILVCGFDISVGAVMAFSGVACALAIGQFGLAGLIVAPLTGLAIGMANGVLVGRLAVPPIIATLGTLLLTRALGLVISNNGQVVLVTGEAQLWLLDFSFGTVAGIPFSTLACMVAFAVAALFLRYTSAGRRLFLIGGNAEAARLIGVNTTRGTILAYALCGACAGLAGMLFLMRSGTGVPTDGVGMELNAIAVAVIGGSLLTGGAAFPVRVLIAALFIQVIYTGLSFSALSPYVGEIVLGAIILSAGLFDSAVRTFARSDQ